MCRFLLYMGAPVAMDSLLTEPTNSLIRQSYASKERVEPLNGDGFGVAWYEPDIDERPGLFKSVTPAWSNRNLHNLARVTKSPCVLAHVRAATSVQSVSEFNCHPFSWSKYAFCHNGDVGGFHTMRRRLLAELSEEAFNVILGGTDSEHAFAVFVDRIRGTKETDPAEAMGQALMQTIKYLVKLCREIAPDEHCYLNFAVTDGKRAAVSHCSTDPDYADSLHINTHGTYAVVKGQTQIIPKQSGTKPNAVIVASEALTSDSHWRRVALNEIMVIDEDLSVTTRDVILDVPV